MSDRPFSTKNLRLWGEGPIGLLPTSPGPQTAGFGTFAGLSSDWLPGFHWAKSLHPSRCGAYVHENLADTSGLVRTNATAGERTPLRKQATRAPTACGTGPPANAKNVQKPPPAVGTCRFCRQPPPAAVPSCGSPLRPMGMGPARAAARGRKAAPAPGPRGHGGSFCGRLHLFGRRVITFRQWRRRLRT
jgi:hypothetical protein